ncbi:MAG: hypothetical protein CSB15_00525 [Clostridiales bacterium]|nr:MAG: hypothetical protein CSB15_00525 [Clostridiales bacterium]
MKYNLEKLNLNHIAIIMDGNGRWAKSRSLPRIMGHKEGMKTLRNIVKYSGEIGLKYLSVFAFSNENWSRPQDEVSGLMNIVNIFCKNEEKELNKNNVKIRFIGSSENMSDRELKSMRKLENALKDNTGLNFNVFINYGSRQEIISAIKDINDMNIESSEIDETLFESKLMTYGIPDPDLVIRTSGEQRISNFLLYQLSYAELYFTDSYWPDFNEESLDKAIENFSHRKRRYGGLL